MSEVIITVRGESEAHVLPERATVRLVAATDGPARGGVVERLAALAEPLRTDLTARKDAGSIVDWSSQRVSVWADRPWNNEGRQLDPVHHASVELTATFTDVIALSDWLNEVSAIDGVRVGDVQWELTPETRAQVERTVATQAVQVAVERANAYAQAIGKMTVTPLQIADLGLLADSGPQAPKFAVARGMAMDSAPPVVEFRPDEIVVRAGVEGRFSAV